ncbi:MAG TPA: hypothetical protein VN915_03555 [Elusimicrobiota bacterium]|nr:hypothetical protein [Elusimicrobiota bacterium]
MRTRTSTRPALAAAAAALALLAAPARASFDAPLATPQSAAMGGASLAGIGDSAALFLNPAAAARLEHPEAYFMYNQLYTGLKGAGGIGQGFASFGVPTKYGTLAAGYGEFQATGLVDERVVGLSYSRTLFGVLDAGVTGKYLSHSYNVGSDPLAASDPVFAHGTGRGALSLDAGVIASLSDSLKAGVAVRNINEPDVGLASLDRVPREIQAGLKYDITAWALRLTADYVYRDVPSGTFAERAVPSVGLEKGFMNDAVRFRAGATPDTFTGGVGIRVGPVDFDYAFVLTRGLMANNAGSQQAGFRYRFGGPSKTDKTEKQREEAASGAAPSAQAAVLAPAPAPQPGPVTAPAPLPAAAQPAVTTVPGSAVEGLPPPDPAGGQ